MNAHARDTTATSGFGNLSVRPMVGVSPSTIIWVAVEGVLGTLRRLPMGIAYV